MTRDASSAPLVPVSWGEVIDKITILEIKSLKITDATANANVRRELDALNQVLRSGLVTTEEISRLRALLSEINSTLWDIEDSIRACEASSDFGEEFIQLSRSVYKQNDLRSQVKREINFATSSVLFEEKSYRMIPPAPDDRRSLP